MKLKKHLFIKGNCLQSEEQSTEWEGIVDSCPSDRGLISRMHRELKDLNIKNTNKPIFETDSLEK